ncbi:MAG TPA: D-2-hydroxyacid dehydrogenase [Bryobacteraceae bacterium]|jgi:glycerate dehydrogenase
MKIVILDGYCLNPGDLSWDALRSIAPLEVYDRTAEDQVVTRASGAEIVLTNKAPFSAATLQQLPELKFIGVLATGYNIVDVAAAKAGGVVVSNIPTYGTASVAQYAIALLLELCHHVGAHGEAVRQGEWSSNPDWSFWKSPLVELAGKTMGIVGYGRIGRQTAAIAHALGMQIVANDVARESVPEWLPIDRLLAESDVVSLHCPLTPENKGMIDRRRLTTMKPSALLINTSRGPLIVDQDLADALNNGTIAGAGLDVLSLEPPPPSNPLLQARNCIVTPHIAWATREARERLLDIAVENVKAFVAGRPQNVVSG